MRCPNCAHDIELTWRRYFRAELSLLPCLCPACSKQYKIQFSGIALVLFLALFIGIFISEVKGLEITGYMDQLLLYFSDNLYSHTALTLILWVPVVAIQLSLMRLWQIKYGLLKPAHDKSEGNSACN